MPKILILANTDWYLFNFRIALGRFLRDEGYDVAFVSPPGEYVSLLDAEGFRWIRWNLSRKRTNPWEELDALFALTAIYRKEKPDIVHHHTIKPVIYGALAAWLTRVHRVVHSITGRGYVFLSTDLKARLLKWFVSIFYRSVLRFPNIAVIFENQFDRGYFIESGFVSESKTWLIEGVGTDPDKFTPIPESTGTPLIVYSGRMLWDKGVGLLVEAARIIKDRLDVRVALVGMPDPGNDGSVDEGTLREWHAEGLVEWWEWRSDMPAVYQQAHIIALPTRYGEGVPTSLIEGAACGRPLVAGDIPGCHPIVQHGVNGYLVPPDDMDALVQALERLISDPELRQTMGKNSRKLVMENFTHKKINQATLAVYQHIR
jgi:glycosyltransferase involved in cell wall biosynthesis